MIHPSHVMGDWQPRLRADRTTKPGERSACLVCGLDTERCDAGLPHAAVEWHPNLGWPCGEEIPDMGVYSIVQIGFHEPRTRFIPLEPTGRVLFRAASGHDL